MPPALRLRITTFAVLIVISFAVHGPSASSAVELGSLGRVSNDVLGMCTPDQVTNLASGDNGEPLYAFLDDSVVMSAFDTPHEYATHVMGIHYADPAIGFATMDGDSQRIEGRQASGVQSASPMVSSASAPVSTQQHAPIEGTGATAGIAQQSQNLSPVSGSSEADRLVNVASPAEADVVASARPTDDGGTTNPGKQGKPSPASGSQDANPVIDIAKTGTGDGVANTLPGNDGTTNPSKQGKPSPATGSQDANPVIDVAKAGTGDGVASTLPGNDGTTHLGPQASNPSPATGNQTANPIIIAKAGEDDGLDPYIKGKGTPDLIASPDWVGEPTAGGSAPGSNPAAECDSGGTCDANKTVASNAVPEPGSMALLGLGMIGLVWARRRKAAIARA